MSFGHCSCPDCGTTLRIRDRAFVGREVPCPECHITLLIELNSSEVLTASKRLPTTTSSSSVATVVKRLADSTHVAHSLRRVRGLRRLAASPLMMAWALALAITSLVVVALLRPAIRFETPSGTRVPSDVRDDGIALDQRPPSDQELTPPSSTVNTMPSPKATESVAAVDALTPENLNEPLETNPPPNVVPPSVANADQPGTVKPATVVPPVAPQPDIDFEVALNQKLLSYEQAKPVSRRELIESLEELLGAPIRFDATELGDKNLDKTTTFKLEETTVGGVLNAVLAPAGWEFTAEKTHLRIRLKSSVDAASR